MVLSLALRRGLSTSLELISADLFCLLLNLGCLSLALLLNLVDFLLGEPLLLSLDPPFKLLVLLFLLELCRFLARLCLLHLLLDLLLVLQFGLLFGRIDFLVLFSDICADSDGRRLTPRIIASTLHLLRGRGHSASEEVPASTHASHILLLESGWHLCRLRKRARHMGDVCAPRRRLASTHVLRHILIIKLVVAGLLLFCLALLLLVEPHLVL